MKIIEKVDEFKRGKMIIVAVLVSAIVFGFKLFQRDEISTLGTVYIRSSVIALLSFLGVLWAFKLQVSRRTVLFVLSQVALFVFNQTLFVELFIFHRVGRVYEALILLATLVITSALTYVGISMANIFNVASIKEIPLVQVGKTASFLLTLLSIYFVSFAFVESGFFMPLLIALLAIEYLVLTILHLRHVGVARNLLWRNISIIVVVMTIAMSIGLIVGENPLIISIIPTVVFYSLTNIITSENISGLQIIEYVLLSAVVMLANMVV